jgi:D-sedoheptulose 7-phosphate isomerase
VTTEGSGVASFSEQYLQETIKIIDQLDTTVLEQMVDGLAEVRDSGGRLFVPGVGGSAGSAGHAVNDFRKICGFEAYTPTDNVSELTARTNDDSWESVFSEWLRCSRLDARDALMVFSVGGGDVERGISVNLVRAVAVDEMGVDAMSMARAR